VLHDPKGSHYKNLEVKSFKNPPQMDGKSELNDLIYIKNHGTYCS